MKLSQAQKYVGILMLLENERMLSMSLAMEFRKNTQRSFDVNDDEYRSLEEHTKDHICFESSCVYVDWKQEVANEASN